MSFGELGGCHSRDIFGITSRCRGRPPLPPSDGGQDEQRCHEGGGQGRRRRYRGRHPADFNESPLRRGRSREASLARRSRGAVARFVSWILETAGCGTRTWRSRRGAVGQSVGDRGSDSGKGGGGGPLVSSSIYHAPICPCAHELRPGSI